MFTQTASLGVRIRALAREDAAFARGHRLVCAIMGSWIGVILVDRLIGLLSNTYEQSYLFSVIGGATILILVAFWGMNGHLTLATVLFQINLVVLCAQFCFVCFRYGGYSSMAITIFYGAAALLLLSGSLLLFLHPAIAAYRQRVDQLRGKTPRPPRFYRTNNRLVRNPDRKQDRS